MTLGDTQVRAMGSRLDEESSPQDLQLRRRGGQQHQLARWLRSYRGGERSLVDNDVLRITLAGSHVRVARQAQSRAIGIGEDRGTLTADGSNRIAGTDERIAIHSAD